MKEYRKQICRLLDSGISNMSEIGRRVGYSRENVRQLLTNTGHYKNGGKIERNKSLVLKLRGEGYSSQEIAKTLGCSKEGIFYALKRWGAGRGSVREKRV